MATGTTPYLRPTHTKQHCHAAQQRLYYGGKHVSTHDVPIGLRWTPVDSQTPVEMFAYAGMMVSLMYAN